MLGVGCLFNWATKTVEAQKTIRIPYESPDFARFSIPNQKQKKNCAADQIKVKITVAFKHFYAEKCDWQSTSIEICFFFLVKFASCKHIKKSDKKIVWDLTWRKQEIRLSFCIGAFSNEWRNGDQVWFYVNW